MDLNEIVVFSKVVEVGSFVGAARELEMPKSTVSRKVSDLEERLGARLLQRTTRKLSLTDVGRTFYQHAARVVAEVEEAERAVSRLQEVPRGSLRVTAPLNFGYVGPVIASFLERYPEVQLEMVCADRNVDLIAEAFDVAIRVGALADSALIARSVGGLRSVLVASPAYAKREGVPKSPVDLPKFACLSFGAGIHRSSWTLLRGDESVTVAIEARFQVNDFDFLDHAVRMGCGIALLPLFRCEALLRDGTLRRVLPRWASPELPIHAVYPSSRHLSPKVRAFLDHLGEEMDAALAS